MQTPWTRLPNAPPYVLPEDAEFIERFNLTARPEQRLHLDDLPEPFLGAADAPVVLLNLNPGHAAHNVENHKRPEFRKANRAQLELRPTEYPFYLLDPAVQFDGGYRWWSKRLRQPIEALGREAVARGLLCVEFFPYHSEECGLTPTDRVPSQEFSFHLVRAAMSRGALVLLMRARKYWLGEIPELATYANLLTLRNVQSPYLSERNCPGGYQRILSAIAMNGRRAVAR
jgi:hypothetical protein